MQKLEDQIFRTGFADTIAEEGLSELKERDEWDANEMSQDELAKLMATWNQVAAEQSRVMQDVWDKSDDQKMTEGSHVPQPQYFEEEKKELFDDDDENFVDFADPNTEGEFITSPAPAV